jgi:ketosteroid isomerase-like protein
MTIIDRRSTLALGMAAALVSSGSAAAASLDEARAVFERFVAAQNAHDAAAVEAMLWDSPDFLWVTRGTAIWGRAAAMERFRALYRGTWNLAPDMAQFRAAALGDAAAQLFVPVLFTIGALGQPAQPTRFLMNQTLLRAGGGWRIASILPIPAPTQ